MHSLGILVVAMAIVFTALESGGLAIPCGALVRWPSSHFTDWRDQTTDQLQEFWGF